MPAVTRHGVKQAPVTRRVAPARARLFELTCQQARQRFRGGVRRPPQPGPAELQSLRDRAQALLGMATPDAALAARLRLRACLLAKLHAALRPG